MATLKDFDWSLLDRRSIIRMVHLCKHEIVDKTLAPKVIYKTLVDHIKQYLPIRASVQYRACSEPSRVYVGGVYYSHYDQQQNRSIGLVFQFNPQDEHICIQPRVFKKIATLIADTILHEIIHMKQYRARQFKELPAYASTAENSKKRSTQSYFGNTDEIDAYSFNIACELHDKFKADEHKIIAYLSKHQPTTLKKKNAWVRYLHVFDNNHNHKIIKRVKKRVMYYLPYAALGKPFKTSDWLSQ